MRGSDRGVGKVLPDPVGSGSITLTATACWVKHVLTLRMTRMWRTRTWRLLSWSSSAGRMFPVTSRYLSKFCWGENCIIEPESNGRRVAKKGCGVARLVACPLVATCKVVFWGPFAQQQRWAVLRMRMRDPLPFWPPDPGSGMGKKSRSGSYFRELGTNFLG